MNSREAFGWLYARICSGLDREEDPRRLPIPALWAECEKDLLRTGREAPESPAKPSGGAEGQEGQKDAQEGSESPEEA